MRRARHNAMSQIPGSTATMQGYTERRITTINWARNRKWSHGAPKDKLNVIKRDQLHSRQGPQVRMRNSHLDALQLPQATTTVIECVFGKIGTGMKPSELNHEISERAR